MVNRWRTDGQFVTLHVRDGSCLTTAFDLCRCSTENQRRLSGPGVDLSVTEGAFFIWMKSEGIDAKAAAGALAGLRFADAVTFAEEDFDPALVGLVHPQHSPSRVVLCMRSGRFNSVLYDEEDGRACVVSFDPIPYNGGTRKAPPFTPFTVRWIHILP